MGKLRITVDTEDLEDGDHKWRLGMEIQDIDMPQVIDILKECIVRLRDKGGYMDDIVSQALEHGISGEQAESALDMLQRLDIQQNKEDDDEKDDSE